MFRLGEGLTCMSMSIWQQEICLVISRKKKKKKQHTVCRLFLWGLCFSAAATKRKWRWSCWLFSWSFWLHWTFASYTEDAVARKVLLLLFETSHRYPQHFHAHTYVTHTCDSFLLFRTSNHAVNAWLSLQYPKAAKNCTRMERGIYGQFIYSRSNNPSQNQEEITMNNEEILFISYSLYVSNRGTT